MDIIIKNVDPNLDNILNCIGDIYEAFDEYIDGVSDASLATAIRHDLVVVKATVEGSNLTFDFKGGSSLFVTINDETIKSLEIQRRK